MKNEVPVVTIDGPSGCGKGTIAQLVAKQLGWFYLDSGALYRAMAWAVIEYKIDIDNLSELQSGLEQLNINFSMSQTGAGVMVHCNDVDITAAIREESCGIMASKIAVIQIVRSILHNHQLAMCKLPGLVADGRDMGSVVFPNAIIKFYFQADAKERAKRRYNQLKQKGINVSLPRILEELLQRDERDQSRAISPAMATPDMILLDTSCLSIDQVFSKVMEYIRRVIE